MIKVGDNFKCCSRNFNKYLNIHGYTGKHGFDEYYQKEYWLFKNVDNEFINLLVKWKKNKENGIKEIKN